MNPEPTPPGIVEAVAPVRVSDLVVDLQTVLHMMRGNRELTRDLRSRLGGPCLHDWSPDTPPVDPDTPALPHLIHLIDEIRREASGAEGDLNDLSALL